MRTGICLSLIHIYLLREGQILLTCIHPAAHPEEGQALLDKKVIAFTAEDSHRYGSPNCEAAGKQGALSGLHAMLTTNGGKGKFVSGLAGAPGMNLSLIHILDIQAVAEVEMLCNRGSDILVYVSAHILGGNQIFLRPRF